MAGVLFQPSVARSTPPLVGAGYAALDCTQFRAVAVELGEVGAVIGHRQRSTPEASSTNSWLAIGFVVSEPNCHGPSTCDLARFYMTEIVPLDGTRATNCYYRVVKV